MFTQNGGRLGLELAHVNNLATSAPPRTRIPRGPGGLGEDVSRTRSLSAGHPARAPPSTLRRMDALERAELAEKTAEREAARAQVLIDRFVADALASGPEPVPLRARTLDGHTVRTDRRGWYLRRDHSIAIDTDGGYHVLHVPGGLMARLRGVKLEPTRPSLRVGRGGRDGETGDLREFLAWVLEGRTPQSP